jgi:geranylgeranyl diphosphate synthase type I
MEFQMLLEDKRRIVNDHIDKILSSGFEHSEARELVKYTFKTGGKRLRPIMVLLASKAVGGEEEPALNAAVAVEFVHAASLIFDDLIDKDRLRRDVPALNVAFNDDRAISSGLFLASKGVEVLSDYRNPKIMKMIGWALVELSKGEMLDVISDIGIDVEHYLNIADLKTGALFAASAGIGGLVGSGSREEINALYNYGRAVGLAFQIRDDILDLTGESGQARTERANLVLTHYLGESTRHDRVSQILNHNGTKKRDDPLESLRQKALSFAKETSVEYVHRAKSALVPLKEGEGKDMLTELAEFAHAREK